MQTQLSRPFRPISLAEGAREFFALPRLADALRSEDEYARSGVSALTLTRDELVTSLLVSLRKGSVMHEHRAPSAATLLVVSGRVKFVAGDGGVTELTPGCLAAFAGDVRHAIEAREDSTLFVSIGGRQRPASDPAKG